MTDRERRDEAPEARPGEEAGAESRPRIKVTDRRRVRAEEGPAPSTETASPEAESATGGSGPEVGAVPSGGPDAGTASPDAGAELEEARKQAAEYRDHLQRLAAEFDNYRKRVLKEQTRAVEMAAEPLVRKLLEVLDEFELALMAAERKPDFERFLHGVELVYAKLLDILRSEGLERIEAQGRPFDPTLHEALMQVDGGEGEPRVVDVLRQGYTLKGRVIRPAGVKIARQ